MRTISAAFHSQGDTRAKVKAIRFISILYAAIGLFATSLFGASLQDVTRAGGEAPYDSAINQNFDRLEHELSKDVVHRTSTETITGYKYFVNPVDFGTVTADSGTITALNATTISATTVTFSSATITTLDSPVARYQRPDLVWVSTNAVAVSSNTGTTNQTAILFRNGVYRTVTENTASADKYRLFYATATANFTSGTEDSGLRSTYILTNNTSYTIYAVQSQINPSNFVLVGDTITCTTSNYSSLNTAYGTNGWACLGIVRNGDSSANASGLLAFVQKGSLMKFYNTSTGGSMTGEAAAGIQMANTVGTSLTYTYASGTGDLQIPDTISHVYYTSGVSLGGAGNTIVKDSAAARYIASSYANGTQAFVQSLHTAAEGINTSGSNGARDIWLSGFIDGSLTDGAGGF